MKPIFIYPPKNININSTLDSSAEGYSSTPEAENGGNEGDLVVLGVEKRIPFCVASEPILPRL